MSRNSSVRSSFSFKTEEDFRDEILDLKRQLVRMKEESKLLKVQLRRSEENAARKEKIICTMIDPMKAHLSTKSIRNHRKLSQGKESSMKHESKDHCQGLCSRAYRHYFNCSPQTDSMSRVISSAGQQRRKNKGNLKVTASMEFLSPFHSKSSESDLLSSNKYSKNVQNISSCQRTGSGASDKMMSREFFKKIKGRESAFTHDRNSVQRKEINVPKKKRSENHARDNYPQFYSGSESSSPSLLFNLKESKRKGVEMKRGVNESPVDSVDCEQCRFRSLRKETSAPSDCSKENLLLEGKKLVSSWKDNGLNSNEELETPEVLALDSSCGESKFGIYHMKEDPLADDICRDVDKQRRESIFRVDIKKKEPKEETDDMKSGLNDIIVKDIGSFKNATGIENPNEVGCDAVRDCADLIMMEQMMDSLSITEQSVSNCIKISDFANIIGGNDERKLLDKQSTSIDSKSLLHLDEDNLKKYDEFYCNGINCCRTLSGWSQRSILSIQQDLSGIHNCENEVMLDLMLQSGDSEAFVNSN